MEKICSSETSVGFHRTTRRYNSEDRGVHITRVWKVDEWGLILCIAALFIIIIIIITITKPVVGPSVDLFWPQLNCLTPDVLFLKIWYSIFSQSTTPFLIIAIQYLLHLKSLVTLCNLSIHLFSPSQQVWFYGFYWVRCLGADHSGRAVWGTTFFRPLRHWDRQLKTHSRQEY
jgi:hypothetical protein